MNRRTRELCRRRTADALLWRAIEGEDGRHKRRGTAADRITTAFRIKTGGLCVKVQSFERRGRTHAQDWRAHQVQIVQDYDEWCTKAPRHDIVISDVLQVLVHGEQLRQQDERNRQRNGTATRHLLDALELYAHLRGWG